MLLTCSAINDLSAKRFVNWMKEGGIFGFYNYVNQQFEGTDPQGNTHYSMTCLEPGFTRCRLSNAPYRVNPTPRDTEIENFENQSIVNKVAEIENLNQPNGTRTYRIRTTLSDGSQIETILKITWTDNANKFSAEVESINL